MKSDSIVRRENALILSRQVFIHQEVHEETRSYYFLNFFVAFVIFVVRQS